MTVNVYIYNNYSGLLQYHGVILHQNRIWSKCFRSLKRPGLLKKHNILLYIYCNYLPVICREFTRIIFTVQQWDLFACFAYIIATFIRNMSTIRWFWFHPTSQSFCPCRNTNLRANIGERANCLLSWSFHSMAFDWEQRHVFYRISQQKSNNNLKQFFLVCAPRLYHMSINEPLRALRLLYSFEQHNLK